MEKPSPWGLGIVGLATSLIIDLIGIVAMLVLDVRQDSALGLWVTAGIAGLTAGVIVGTFADRQRFLVIAGISSLIGALFFGVILWIAIDTTGIARQLGRLYLVAALFQLAGAIAGSLAGHYGRPRAPDQP